MASVVADDALYYFKDPRLHAEADALLYVEVFGLDGFSTGYAHTVARAVAGPDIVITETAVRAPLRSVDAILFYAETFEATASPFFQRYLGGPRTCSGSGRGNPAFGRGSFL